MKQMEMGFVDSHYKKENILKNIKSLILMYKDGRLGGEVMPEDARPSEIKEDSPENFLFLTLPMALNYQRNSYKLWESAAAAYLDEETRTVYYPKMVEEMPTEVLREKLLKHKVALQPNKHINTWQRLCSVISEKFDGDVRNIFEKNESDVSKIREYMQVTDKKRFPYLSGHKIFNYWLHVIEDYSPISLKNRQEITIAPDTHIIQGSLRLKLVSGEMNDIAQKRTIVSDAWKEALEGTNIAPIDVHTPLWLWSKRGFPKIDET